MAHFRDRRDQVGPPDALLSRSAPFSYLTGLDRARDNIKKVANQSTVVKPYLAKILFFDGACLFELLITVSFLTGARRKPNHSRETCLTGLAHLSCAAQFPGVLGLGGSRDNAKTAANQSSTVVKSHFAQLGLFSSLEIFLRSESASQCALSDDLV